ncbi:unnamed protein product [Pieris macdunnoughi]|uniref:Uncharacterized protein n=1 Tax=Pieris macdunnoughi TaxID=345717 RepID=A0A821M618_9NEOP|nr:unnamed protein product [Pieris macdunnoughi]
MTDVMRVKPQSAHITPQEIYIDPTSRASNSQFVKIPQQFDPRSKTCPEQYHQTISILPAAIFESSSRRPSCAGAASVTVPSIDLNTPWPTSLALRTYINFVIAICVNYDTFGNLFKAITTLLSNRAIDKKLQMTFRCILKH